MMKIENYENCFVPLLHQFSKHRKFRWSFFHVLYENEQFIVSIESPNHLIRKYTYTSIYDK